MPAYAVSTGVPNSRAFGNGLCIEVCLVARLAAQRVHRLTSHDLISGRNTEYRHGGGPARLRFMS